MSCKVMIYITTQALEKLQSIREGSKALRVAVIGGGCSGLSYKMEWVEESTITDKDNVFAFDNLSVVVDGKSSLYLRGSQLDFSDGLDGTGFNWSNPNAARSCGCGSSFST
jgi:iron-sulfur cluster assembly protein